MTHFVTESLVRRQHVTLHSSDGTIFMVQRFELVASSADEPDLPGLPDNSICLGYVLIVNVTNAFVLGTTLLSAAGVTDTYVDLVWPDSCLLRWRSPPRSRSSRRI